MKPVTAGDVARYASGRITDPDEEDRIFRAILDRPELEELYFMLTDASGDGAESDELGSEAASLTPEAAARIEETMKFQSLLSTARLCRLDGFLPGSGAVEDISMPLHWAAGAASVVCRLAPVPEKCGVYRVHVNLPANRSVLSLVAADLSWGNPSDLTRVRLHKSWSDRPTPAVEVQEADRGAGTVVSLAAASGLLAETAPRETLREHLGETWDAHEGEKPWSVRIVALARKMLFPLPILLRGLAADGTVMAEEVRVISYSGEDLENLFETCGERVHWLEVAPLALNDAHRLAPRHAAELLGASKYAVCLLEPVPGSTGEYMVDLSDAAVQERLDSRDVVLALQIAEVEGQVQP
jgi:hypothetical protein